MKKFLTIMVLIVLSPAYTNPAPLGLEIGTSTIKDLKDKYKSEFIDKNIYSNGDMYALNVKSISIENLQKATAIYSEDKKLLAVLTVFPKQKFNHLFEMLNKKYKLVNKQIPFVGNKKAEFANGKSTIFLYAPHLGFETTLNYVENNFWKTYLTAFKDNQEKRGKAEQSNF